MENKKYSMALYIALSFVLISCIYALNTIKQISLCAYMFTVITLVSNIIFNSYGIRKFLISIIIACLGASIIFWDIKYCLHGKLINGLIGTSLVSVFISSVIGAVVLKFLPKNLTFKVRNLIAMISSATTDGIIMGIFFLTKYSVTRVFAIFHKELMYKILYASFIFIIIFLVERFALTLSKYRVKNTL